MNDRSRSLEAWLEQLIAEEMPKIIRKLRSRFGEPDCYDETQAIMLTFVNKARDPAVTFTKSARAYLWGIVRNHERRLLERRCAQRARFGGNFDSSVHTGFQLTGFRSTRLSGKVGKRRDVEAALQELSIEQADAFVLHHVEGFTIAEVQQILGLSRATVNRRIKAARESLAKWLCTADAGLSASDLELLITGLKGPDSD